MGEVTALSLSSFCNYLNGVAVSSGGGVGGGGGGVGEGGCVRFGVLGGVGFGPTHRWPIFALQGI